MTSLYRRSLIVSVAIALLVSIVGMLAIFQVRRYERERSAFSPAVFSARLYDEVSAAGLTPEKALHLVETASLDTAHSMVEILGPEEASKRLPPGETLPTVPYDARLITNMSGTRVARLVRLQSPPEHYLYANFGGEHRFHILGTTFGVLLVSMVLATLISITIVFMSLRRRAADVSSTLTKLQQGDLKARLPVRRIDESAPLLIEFNKMADEIERLVERVKQTEGARMEFFRELTHDLRTPVASMKNLLETLSVRSSSVSAEVREQFLALALKEIDYFGRLIDDLLFLAQVTEPKYRLNEDSVNLAAIIDDELERVLTNARVLGKPLQANRDSADHVEIAADEQLLRRMFRNAFENAASFAKTKIVVKVTESSDGTQILICDDGPGFSAEALRTFGEKRATRVLGPDAHGRLSVGLGSVVMSAAANAHAGTIAIRNAETGGAIVDIQLHTITQERA